MKHNWEVSRKRNENTDKSLAISPQKCYKICKNTTTGSGNWIKLFTRHSKIIFVNLLIATVRVLHEKIILVLVRSPKFLRLLLGRMTAAYIIN